MPPVFQPSNQPRQSTLNNSLPDLAGLIMLQRQIQTSPRSYFQTNVPESHLQLSSMLQRQIQTSSHDYPQANGLFNNPPTTYIAPINMFQTSSHDYLQAGLFNNPPTNFIN